MTDPVRILIVDDDAWLREAIRAELVAEGYPSALIEEASFGDAALDMCVRHRYAVIISDYRMPGISGGTMLGVLLKRQPWAKRILISGLPGEDTLHDAVNVARVDAYFPKPWPPGALAASVRKLAGPPGPGGAPPGASRPQGISPATESHAPSWPP